MAKNPALGTAGVNEDIYLNHISICIYGLSGQIYLLLYNIMADIRRIHGAKHAFYSLRIIGLDSGGKILVK